MILDTCALLWLASGSPRLGQRTLKEINETPVLAVSAISAFEIALKVARGKLSLPEPSSEWFARVTEHHGVAILPLDFPVCIAAAELPWIHDDPCDRFIIAEAKGQHLKVVTDDERFEKYGIEVLPCR